MTDTMTKKEFLHLCHRGGYCSDEAAKAYVKDYNKESYDDDDIIAVHRYRAAASLPTSSKTMILNTEGGSGSIK